MNGSRFEDVLSRMLDEEFTDDELSEIVELAKDDPERVRELQAQLEAAEMLAQSHDDLRNSALFVAATESRIGEDPFVASMRSAITATDRAGARGNSSNPPGDYSKWSWGLATCGVVALATVVFFLRPHEEPEVVRITQISGSLQWTGDGGRVTQEFRAGDTLPGGTWEGLSPATWVALKFRDGSTVTLLGKSLLTVSDHGQKVLHLREGYVSADVALQPDDKPMLIHTRTGTLEVLGTQLNVEAELSSTLLIVNKGRVRVKRLNDGSVVDVPANHRAVVAADSALAPVVIPQPANQWSSELELGPDDVYLGKWLPASGQRTARLKAIPIMFNPVGKSPQTLYLVSLSVSHGEQSPVALEPGSRFRIRGRIDDACDVHFGVNTYKPTGGFANKFKFVQPARTFARSDEFEIELPLGDFQPFQPQPSSPAGLIVGRFWCHTVNQSAGLEISHVELLPPPQP